MTRFRIVAAAAGLAGFVLLLIAHPEAQGREEAAGQRRELAVEFVKPQKPAYDDGAVEAFNVQGTVWMVAGGGANIAVQVDPDGMLLVDTGSKASAQKTLAAIKTISPRPIRQIINTSSLIDRVEANEDIGRQGQNIYASISGGADREPERVLGAPILSHERAMHRLAGILGNDRRDNIMWPQNTFFGPRKDWYWAGEPIDILYKPAAVTDGDVIVWFRKSDVIATGAILDTVHYPRIDVKRGGTVQGYLDALNDILDIMIPARGNQGGTLAIPGNGRLVNESDVAEIRDSMTIVIDRIRDMVTRKLTLAQVKDARPTIDYDGVFGDPNPFIEAVYTDLTREAATASAGGAR